MPPTPMNQGRDTLRGDKQHVQVHIAGESRSQVEGPGLPLSVSEFVAIVLFGCASIQAGVQDVLNHFW